MPRIARFTSEAVSAKVLTGIRELVDGAFGGDFTDNDWHHALGGSHIVALKGRTVISHAAVVTRTIEVDGQSVSCGYVEAVATERTRQRSGIGSAIMVEAADLIRHEHDMGALSTSLHEFYTRLGWERWRGPSYVRSTAGLVRTKDEDDGILVLRFGSTASVDLTSSIVCEERSGDNW